MKSKKRTRLQGPLVVYIAGPYRAKPIVGQTQPNQWQQQQNIRRAEELSWRCWASGRLVPVCPHLNTLHFQGSLPDDVWLTGDLEILKRCDAVLLVPGWARSEGTKSEIAFARKHNIPVFGCLEDLLVLMGYV